MAEVYAEPSFGDDFESEAAEVDAESPPNNNKGPVKKPASIPKPEMRRASGGAKGNTVGGQNQSGGGKTKGKGP